MDAPRKLLQELLSGHPDYDMKSLSEAVGKNAAYIQQYMKKGSPKNLDEETREKIGHALGVNPDMLRPESDPKRAARALPSFSAPTSSRSEHLNLGAIRVPEYDISPQAEGGALAPTKAIGDYRAPVDVWSMPQRLVEAFVENPANLAIIRVMGDSMEPDYMAGDRVMVDIGHIVPSPPAVYVLNDGMGFVLKRVEIVFGSTDPVMVRISSINPAYSTYERALQDVHINGRIIGKWVWK